MLDNKTNREIRSFIAIPLANELLSQVATVSSELQRQSDSIPIKWVNPHSIHLTLKFLGNISPELIPSISEILNQIPLEFKPFELRIDQLGAFPNTQNVRVIWLGLENSEVISAIKSRLDHGLLDLGFEKEKKKYSPHLTLGRAKRHITSQDKRRMGQIVENTSIPLFNIINVKKINLYQSILTPTGAKYQVLDSTEL